MKEQFQKVDDHFASDDKEYEDYKSKVAEKFAFHYRRIQNNDSLISQIHVTLAENQEEREELRRTTEAL